MRRLSTCTLDCVLAMGSMGPDTLMSAFIYAGNALWFLGDSKCIEMWYKQYQTATQLAASPSEKKRKSMYSTVAAGALDNAIVASKIYYGLKHPYTTSLRDHAIK